MIVHLVRHGQTEFNREGVFRGLLDVPLDTVGQRQAERAGRSLSRHAGPAVPIVAGPLSRTRLTAEAIAAATGGEVTVEPGLTDLALGEWEGLPYGTVATRYPALFRAWREDPDQCRFPGGDDFSEFAGRVMECYRNLCRGDHPRLIVVSHRVVIRVIVTRLLELPGRGFWSFLIGPASITTVQHGEDPPVILHLNDTCHLELDSD